MARSIKLTAEWFNQIVATLKSDTHQIKGHEKRTEGRVGLRCQLDLIARPPVGAASAKPITVWVRDISVNGMGLVSSTPIEAGAELIANFARHAMPPLAVVYKVRYSRRISADLYSVGANLKTVVNGTPPPPKPEKRKTGEAKTDADLAAASPVEG